MRKVYHFFTRWYVQLFLVLLVIVLGISGYTEYYKEKPAYLRTPVYSTIRLFSGAYDANQLLSHPVLDENNQPVVDDEGKAVTKTDTGLEPMYIRLFIAKWLALFITGHTIFRLLIPLHHHFRSGIAFSLWWLSGKKTLIIGANDENIRIYHSLRKKGRLHPIILCFTEDEFNRLWKTGIKCVTVQFDRIIHKLISDMVSSESKALVLVINTREDETNLSICRKVVDCIKSEFDDDISRIDSLKSMEKKKDAADRDYENLLKSEEQAIRKLERIHVLAFGSNVYESAYASLEDEAYGVLRYTNKYRTTAMDFLANYPLTHFIDRSRINSLGCVDPDYEMNVVFVGFGKTNQEMFTSSMIINQFIQGEQGQVPQAKPVNYVAFDKVEAKNNKHLNHHVFRYGQEFLGGIEKGMMDEADYLELPAKPYNMAFEKIDVNDTGFYEKLWQVCKQYPSSFTEIFIAFGSDLENIDLAQKLLSKRAEWGLEHIQIFVKVRNPENERMLTPSQKSIIPFGNESETIFDLDAFFNNRLEEMAMKKHYLNALIKSRSAGNISGNQREIEIHSLYEWHLYDSDKKLSSIYSILSQRMKLQLMGLDYRERKQHNDTTTLIDRLRKSDRPGTGQPGTMRAAASSELSDAPALPDNRTYFDLYAGDDRPVIDESIQLSDGMEVYKYKTSLTEEDFKHQTLRKNLAVQEHCRWNAYMISRGFIPATRAQILKDNDGKNYDLRYHGNLTTIEGLIQFRDLTGKDRINYDFHLMDQIWWYLNAFGYEIVKTDA